MDLGPIPSILMLIAIPVGFILLERWWQWINKPDTKPDHPNWYYCDTTKPEGFDCVTGQGCGRRVKDPTHQDVDILNNKEK